MVISTVLRTFPYRMSPQIIFKKIGLSALMHRKSVRSEPIWLILLYHIKCGLKTGKAYIKITATCFLVRRIAINRRILRLPKENPPQSVVSLASSRRHPLRAYICAHLSQAPRTAGVRCPINCRPRPPLSDSKLQKKNATTTWLWLRLFWNPATCYPPGPWMVKYFRRRRA